MAPKRHGKANIHASKPELPPFLQRMREQIVASEDVDRRQQGERLRKARGNRPDADSEDDPTIVKISEEDITEEEYKRIKHDLENNYQKEDSPNEKPDELDVDSLIQSRNAPLKSVGSSSSSKALKKSEKHPQPELPSSQSEPNVTNKKTLSYSSDEEDD